MYSPSSSFTVPEPIFLTQDQDIGKMVFTISGSIAATNHIKIPRSMKGSQKLSTSQLGGSSMALHGRFFYLIFKPLSGNTTFHIEVQTRRRTVHRLSLSTMYSSVRTKGHSLQIPLRLVTFLEYRLSTADQIDLYLRTSEKWTVLCLDVPSFCLSFPSDLSPREALVGSRRCSSDRGRKRKS